MRLLIIILCLLAAAGACSSPPPTLAPNGFGPAGPSTRPPTDEELKIFLHRSGGKDYPLYPGDTISISVQGHEDLKIVRVIPPDGRVPLYGVDVTGPEGRPIPAVVMAAGKRIPQLEEELRGHYSRIVSPPYVTANVQSYARKVIYVVGAVSAPGPYDLPDQKRISLLKALAMAGWFTESAARERVVIKREHPTTGEPIRIPPIDVGQIMSANRTELDLVLEPGDIISVDSRESQSVFIFGHVEAPGEYPFTPGLTLSRLISLAGGLRTFAKYSNIRVIRTGGEGEPKTYRVDLQEVLDGESTDPDLSPGDRIYVDERFI